MKKRKIKNLKRRQREFEMLKPFSHWVKSFNNFFLIRLCAPNGEVIDYHPITEKYGRTGNKLFRVGYGDLIDYLNGVS